MNNKTYKKDEEGKYVKKGSASCWMSKDFPITVKDFLPVLTTLGGGNAQLKKLGEFLEGKIFTERFSSGAFPVKIDIPLTLSIRAVITFQNFQHLDITSMHLFDIPRDYRLESRKIAQKTTKCPRKRIVLANAVI
jgi:hypothetical protein